MMKTDKNPIRRIAALIVFTIILVQPFLSLTSTHVEADPGTITVPDDYLTINDAIGNATEGDTIMVRSGTYKESAGYSEAIKIDKRLTIQGEDKATTIIDGMGKNWAVWIFADDVEFSGFTVHNSSISGISGDDGMVISDCIIYNNGWNGIQAVSDMITIVNCTIYGNDDDGIDILDSSDIRIENCVVYNNKMGISLRNSDGAEVSGCETYNNSDDGIYLGHTDDSQVIDCHSYDNGDDGFHLAESNNVRLENCISYDNDNDGIYLWYSNNARIEGSDFYGNSDEGIQLDYSDFNKIIGCNSHDNGDEGALLQWSDYNCIGDFESTNNDLGTYLYYTSTVTICNSTYNSNRIGLYTYYSDKFYVSRTSFHDNSDDGTYFLRSTGILASCNLTNNSDDGIYAENSNVGMRYCGIAGNIDHGAKTGVGGSINATRCWWGDASGPNITYSNPTGLGDKVNWGVIFDPWLTELYQPDALISDLRCHLRELDWLMIYPSFSTEKPLGVAAAMVSDWTASEYVYVKLANVTEGLDTDSRYVNQSTGKPLLDSYTGIITFGGPDVNMVTYYAENGDSAPIHFVVGADSFLFRYSNGTYVPGAELPHSVINHDEDMFVIEVFQDQDGRYELVIQGFGWQGTYAGGKYFERMIFPQLASYTVGWVILKWEDTNGDGFVNMPGEGDTYTLIATGT